MELILGVNKGVITNVPEDKDGIPREVEGPILCDATPDGIVHLEPSPDGKTCDVIGVGVGTASYVASGDSAPGPANVKISGNVITINVAPKPIPQATHIVSTEGPVVPQ